MQKKFNTAGEPRISLEEAENFIEFCEKEDIAILGIEGGKRLKSGFYPDLSMIADFSPVDYDNWSRYRQQCNSGARKFINKFKQEKNLIFIMTLVRRKNGDTLLIPNS